MKRGGSADRKALATYNRATLRTAAAMADPNASPMDRYRAAEAEEAEERAANAAAKPERKS